jgi:hypothetical protein
MLISSHPHTNIGIYSLDIVIGTSSFLREHSHGKGKIVSSNTTRREANQRQI